ncbi:uncharacterized protein LOC132952696 [Metopolophium dirhodum]|uniref:uncharacterized protein LOC132952696 n=1 Tax=Metopolophium dirhodum TaxID=44670 RepID=UPI00298F543A|nr:uncharacterized protein LOC132952696 [Metopolophium dirhodum]
MELSFIQSNLNHCCAAQDLISQYMVEEKIDIALLSDPYIVAIDSNVWLKGTGQCRAAIYVASNGVTIGNVLRATEFVSARLNGVQVYCCYASPNQTLQEFGDMLYQLGDSIRATQRDAPVLITWDFNARSAAWGDWVNNKRGDELGSLFESLNLVILNECSTPTFARGAGSIVDVSAATESLACRARNWRVLDSVFNYSDHHYIRFSLTHNQTVDSANTDPATPPVFRGWDTSGGIDRDTLHTGLLLAERLDQGNNYEEQAPELRSVSLRSRITAACNFVLPARRTPK